jgi:hypothetical protein
MKEFNTERDLGKLIALTKKILAEAKRFNVPMTKKRAKKFALAKLGFGSDEDDSPNFRAALHIQDERR